MFFFFFFIVFCCALLGHRTCEAPVFNSPFVPFAHPQGRSKLFKSAGDGCGLFVCILLFL